MRRILPSIRHYSSWLLSQAAILAGGTADSLLNAHIRDFGNLYAHSLNSLIASFKIHELPIINYLLEEDEDTIGFVPLDSSECERMKLRYYEDDLVTRKPRWHDKGVERLHPKKEMLGRIKDLLADGLWLHTQEVS